MTGRQRRLRAAVDGEGPTCACGAPAALIATVPQCVRCATVDPRSPFFHRKLNSPLEAP